MKIPEISVILPVFNVEKYVARCLDSILAQTYTDYEIICVDDCGTDASMRIVREYQERHAETIRCIDSDQNAGLGGARDKGIAAARGTYIAFIDSDDEITEDYLETYIRAAEENNADIVVGGNTRVTGEKVISFPGVPEDPWYCWVNVSACSKLFRREFLTKYGIDFRGVRTYEDAPFVYRCLAHAPQITVIRNDGYRYYQNPGSITTARRGGRIGLYAAYEANLLSMYRETAFCPEDREILAYIMASQLITNLLFNGQHAGRQSMKEAYRRLDRFLGELDPVLKNNRFVSTKIPVSEPRLNALATFVILKLRRMKLDRAVFEIVSVMPKIR